MILVMGKFSVFIGFIVVTSLIGNGQSIAQATAKKQKSGSFYFAAGGHRIFFTPSTIRVLKSSEPSFDFTLEKVKGSDDGSLKFNEAPQYSYCVGYYFERKKFGIEYQFDHIKYFVQQNQAVHLAGSIGTKQFDQDTMINPAFFQLEHSDGGNYAMLNLVKWMTLAADNHKIVPELMFKAGAGLVIPKTNSTIFGNHRDDRYHISGYVLGMESGLRLRILNYLFVSCSLKGAFANYSHFLISDGYGKQKWFSGQLNYLIGSQFPL
jgi:hypothetical protein